MTRFLDVLAAYILAVFGLAVFGAIVVAPWFLHPAFGAIVNGFLAVMWATLRCAANPAAGDDGGW